VRSQKGAARFTASHVNVGGRLSEILRMDAGANTATLEAQAGELAAALEHDAEGLGGLQRYMVTAHTAEGKQLGRLTIRVRAAGDDEDDSVDSEPATETGLVHQAHRHLEAVMRLHMLGQQGLMSTLAKTLERQQQQIDTLLSGRVETFQLLEELYTHKAEREALAEKGAFKRKMGEQVFKRIDNLLPALVNEFVGKDVLPSEQSPREQQLTALLRSMTEEQLKTFEKGLSPEQYFNLVTLLKTQIEKDGAPAAPPEKGGNGVS
jgi:hypothetical protein